MNIILAIVVSILTLQASAQPPAIQGARISLVPKPQAVLNVTIENRRESPLVEWHIGVTLQGAGQPLMTAGGFGSIQPGERRTVPVNLPALRDVATAAVTLVAFEDGYYEGTAKAVQPWRAAREERAKDLSYWVRVFGLMPRVSEPDLRRYLSERAIERAGQVTSDVSGVRRKLQEVLQRYPSGPDVWIGLDRLRDETLAELAKVTRQPSGGAGGGAVDAVSSVAIVAQEQGTTTTYVAAIENLRGAPIEAMGFEVLEPGSSRVQGGQTSDFCGGGGIQPKEIREMSFGSRVDPNALPVVRLTFLLFGDLSFEGSMVHRDELLRHREKTGRKCSPAGAAKHYVVE
jgi:hypothetical protein